LGPLPGYRSVDVRGFVAAQSGRLTLEWLPVYAPDSIPWNISGPISSSTKSRTWVRATLWELHSESGMSYFSLIARDAGPSETTMNSRTSPLSDRTNVNSSVPLPTKVVSVSGVSGSFGDGPDESNGLLN
jgi:hypothetical protein